MTRRDLIRLSGAGLLLPLAESGCIAPRPEAKLLASLLPLPKLFEVPLPVPPAAQPARSDASTDFYEWTAQPAAARILPGVDTTIWGYEGRFPGPTIEARRGRRVSLRLRNALPVPIVNHLHGGHTAPESDGYPTDLILPEGGFPASLIHDPHMHDPQAHIAQDEREYIYENDQLPTMLWYHDHRMDFTGPQVWRGLAGLYILRDPEEDKLPLPRGGHEIPLVICDRSFDAEGALRYPALDPALRDPPGVASDYMGGVLGDVILVNGAPWPRLEVANVKYRFRILNASNARHYELALDPVPAGGIAFVQIGSDGGLLEAPVEQRSIQIAPAERFDVIVDFSKFRAGSSATLVNKLDSGRFGHVMRFDIARSERDESTIPARLANFSGPREEDAVLLRDFDFSYQRSQHGWMINGKPFDPLRMDARPRLGTTEIWRLQTDFSHPLHLHLVQFRVLSHSGRPGPYDSGWKDTIDLGPGQGASILVRFTDHRGRYVFHCHNLEHEDMSMMGNFEVV